MQYELRFFGMEHYSEARRLWSECDGVALTDADDALNIGNFLERNTGLSFVAITGEELVGTILCGHDGRRGFIHHLAVAPKARRRGIASRLVAASLQSLKANGIEKCHLLVFVNNRQGNEFWRSIGAKFRNELGLYSLTT
ncbi:GNAT family N-acetyltransferase [Herbaspirillum seropedicae]|uniref:GNAT family N-acetyltransferase n=1 Tax=Herbaspirillum seropedicae TaxID=964 RepID=UPI003D99EBE2